MDQRLIGKWYKEELGETLNIFGGNPPGMKLSFSSSGHYNFEPNCVYENGDDLCFEINDEHYRMVYLHMSFQKPQGIPNFIQVGIGIPPRICNRDFGGGITAQKSAVAGKVHRSARLG